MGPEAARLQRMVRGAQKSLEGWEVWTREQRCGDRLGGPGTTCSLQEGAGDNGLEGPVGLTPAASLGFWSRGQASGLASGAGSLLRGGGCVCTPQEKASPLPGIWCQDQPVWAWTVSGRSLETSVSAHCASRGQPAGAAHPGPSWSVSAQAGAADRSPGTASGPGDLSGGSAPSSLLPVWQLSSERSCPRPVPGLCCACIANGHPTGQH